MPEHQELSIKEKRMSDLKSCLYWNETPIKYEDIAKIHACVEGDWDAYYYWILELNTGGFGLLIGDHDYTGWD